MIGQAEKDAKTHLEDANDDGEFHLRRIGECDLVLRHLPNLKREEEEEERGTSK